MKSNPRLGRPAFTLIELMAVITIIVILAGLVIGSMSYVQDKQARSKARVQIELLSKGLEDYKLENGAYPTTVSTTTGLSGSANIPVKSAAGVDTTLYNLLYLDGVTNKTTIYVAELDPLGKQGWTTTTNTAIVDPWSLPYRYRSGLLSSGTASTSTQNPDFDLWSSGKDGLTNPGTPADTKNRDDIRNF